MKHIDFADVRLGLCGWNGSQRAYFTDFDCVEIQSTFYDPPALAVARKWRAAAPSGFEFSIKAWQLITHTAASPTYRRLRSPIPASERNCVGSFRQTEQVWQAWQRTVEIARAPGCARHPFSMPEILPADERKSNQPLNFLPPSGQGKLPSGVGTAWRPLVRGCRAGLMRRLWPDPLRRSA
jgi:hypothetical protein